MYGKPIHRILLAYRKTRGNVIHCYRSSKLAQGVTSHIPCPHVLRMLTSIPRRKKNSWRGKRSLRQLYPSLRVQVKLPVGTRLWLTIKNYGAENGFIAFQREVCETIGVLSDKLRLVFERCEISWLKQFATEEFRRAPPAMDVPCTLLRRMQQSHEELMSDQQLALVLQDKDEKSSSRSSSSGDTEDENERASYRVHTGPQSCPSLQDSRDIGDEVMRSPSFRVCTRGEMNEEGQSEGSSPEEKKLCPDDSNINVSLLKNLLGSRQEEMASSFSSIPPPIYVEVPTSLHESNSHEEMASSSHSVPVEEHAASSNIRAEILQVQEGLQHEPRQDFQDPLLLHVVNEKFNYLRASSAASIQALRVEMQAQLDLLGSRMDTHRKKLAGDFSTLSLTNITRLGAVEENINTISDKVSSAMKGVGEVKREVQAIEGKFHTRLDEVERQMHKSIKEECERIMQNTTSQTRRLQEGVENARKRILDIQGDLQPLIGLDKDEVMGAIQEALAEYQVKRSEYIDHKLQGSMKELQDQLAKRLKEVVGAMNESKEHLRGDIAVEHQAFY